MPDHRFVSYAQHGEDVVLHRALRNVAAGRYVEVGANDPEALSISKAFYDLGWSGVTVDPVDTYADRHASARPRDTFVRAAVTDRDVAEVVLHQFDGTGLSTIDAGIAERHRSTGREPVEVRAPARRLDDILTDAGLQPHDPVHFLVVDTEGAEAEVLASLDLTVWRPWVLVVESTAPLTTEQTHHAWEPRLLEHGYEFCLFDGLSRFYVASERADALRDALSYPACPLDEYVTAEVAHLQSALEESTAARAQIRGELVRWRGRALTAWAAPAEAAASASEVTHLRGVVENLAGELEAVRRTTSWRVTAPLRAVRRVARGR